MKHQRALSALFVAVAVTASACGSGDAAQPTGANAKVIEVSMTDNEFTPNVFDIEAGQAITFRFRNDGKVDHEAILGTAAEQADHEAQMAGEGAGHGSGMDGMDGMDHGDSTGDAITVKPGGSATLTHTFASPGKVLLGCHEPGHYKEGMTATITVG